MRSYQCSVILPAYNEGKGLIPIVEAVVDVLDQARYTFEVILVDDGSQDDTWQVMQQCRERYTQVKGLRFSRNFGHQLAVHAGIKASSGEMVVVMDSDGQDPPELLPKIFALLDEGHDVVNCVRQKRKESGILKLCYYIFYRIYSRLVPFEISLDCGDFSGMNRKTADIIAGVSQHTPFIRGIRGWTGGSQVNLVYERSARQSGISKYSFRRLVLLAITGITAFSKVPLRIASIAGVTISIASLTYAAVIIVQKLLTGYPALSGWTSLAVLISFLGGMHLTVLGIIGEYLGHIFDAVRGMPPFYIAERLGFDTKSIEFDEERASRG